MTFKLHEPPVRSYPYVKNRVLVVDWASLSYHQMFSINTKVSRDNIGILPSEDELIVWRTKMFNRLIEYVKLFNPMHIVLCLEGKNAWRKKVVKDYYSAHTKVYYDKDSYYVASDNYAYKVCKINDDFGVVQIPVKQFSIFESLKHKMLGELPRDKQDMLWGISTTTGTPIIPSYKGKRKAAYWPFNVDKAEWMRYKDEYAVELAPIFRARAVKCDCAEGDDMVYASVNKFAADADEVIVLTHDSDMSQISHPKVKIFDHISNTFTKCINPKAYLDCKVLSGDKSDNISGMAFVDEKTGSLKLTKGTQLGESGALKLITNCPNIYKVSQDNGWGDQYMRNRTLIDLSMVPSDVSEKIDAELSKPEPELGTLDKCAEWGIPMPKIEYYQLLQNFGFYAVLPYENVDPDNFKGEIFLEHEEKKEEDAVWSIKAFGDGGNGTEVFSDVGGGLDFDEDIESRPDEIDMSDYF